MRKFLLMAIALFIAACGGNDLGLPGTSFSVSATGWTQTDWSGGIGPSTDNQYLAGSDVDTAIAGEFTLATMSNWFDTDWQYRREIGIDNSLNTNALTEYQVLVTGLDTGSLITDGKLQAGCEDIRFAGAAGTPLDYVILGDSCDTADTRFWVKVDSIAASTTTTIYAYYGNLAAAAFESWEDTFSYSALTDVGIVGDERLAAGTMNVISLADGNTINDGTSQLNLDEQDTGSFPAAELSVGTVISATDLFYADGVGDGVDMLTPISSAGTLFLHYSNRYNHFYTIYSHWGNANVSVFINGALGWNGTINQGNYIVSNTGTYDDRNVRIESDIPVHVHHYSISGGSFYDSLVLYPAISEFLYGVPSSSLDIAAGTAGANVSWILSDGTSAGSPVVLGANGIHEQTGYGTQGTAGGLRVTSSAPIGVAQLADSDGGESTAFWPQQELGTLFGANEDMQYLSVAAPEPSTTCTVYNSAGAIPANPAAGFTNPYTGGVRTDVNFLYFGNTAGGAWLTAGWMMECDKAVYAYYERHSGAITDEHNLWSYPQMRRFTYPTPATAAPGAEQQLYVISGDLTSNILDTGAGGATWSNLTFTTDDAANTTVKVRSSDSSDMTGAPAFGTCDPVANGGSLPDNNCVTNAERYVQYNVELASTGMATPTFSEIMVGFSSSGSTQADPGPNRIVVSGRRATLDGSGSVGDGLTYTWAIIEGTGSLENENSATPTYVSATINQDEDVRIYLTVQDSSGVRSTDEVIIHVIAQRQGSESLNIIAANANGTLIYEERSSGRIELTTSNASILFPEDIELYVLEVTSEGYLAIGMPNASSETGRVYLIREAIETLSGTIDLGDVDISRVAADLDGDAIGAAIAADAAVGADGTVIGISGWRSGSRLGDYLAAGDLDNSGEDELLIRAVGTQDQGWIYIFNNDLQLIGILMGTDDFPVRSIFAPEILTTDGNEIVLGPENRSLNMNLTRGDLGSVDAIDIVRILQGNRDYAGLRIIDATIIDQTIGQGNTYQALSFNDINGDEQGDASLASQDGNEYIYYGPIAPGTDLPVGAQNFAVTGGSTDDTFGRMIASGDLNGDGVIDIVIGAPTYGDDDRGAIFIVLSDEGAGNPIDVSTSPNVMIIGGADSGDGIGGDLLIADVDGNGADEVYTVKGGETIFVIDLTGQPSPGGGGGSCNLTLNAENKNIPALTSLVAFLLYLILFRLRKRSSAHYRNR